jgi:hypothetical protein
LVFLQASLIVVAKNLSKRNKKKLVATIPSKMSVLVEQASGDRLDMLLKFLPLLITVAGLGIGIWQYKDQQAFSSSQEFQRATWSKQVAAYEELGEVAAQIVTSYQNRDSAEFAQSITDFNLLYWGKLPLVMDKQVEEELKAFYDECNLAKKIGVHYQRKEDAIPLKIRGLTLMQACQKSSHNAWNKSVHY